VSNTELYIISPARIDHPIAFSHVERHRLLTQHVFASFCGSNYLFGVQMNRSGNVDSIDFIVHQQIVPVCTPPPRTEFLRERFRELGLRSANRDQLAQRRIAQRRRYTPSRDVATSDQAP